MGEGFPGETAAGAAIFVQKVRAVLNVRFPGADQPDILFVDKGRGFYSPQGRIVKKFKDASEEHDLQVFHGDDASLLPGSMGDVYLHETAVS